MIRRRQSKQHRLQCKLWRIARFYVPPDEGGEASGDSNNSGGSGAATGAGGANGNSNNSGAISDETQVVLEDGATVTLAELRRGYARQADATEKWQEAAELRRKAEEKMAEVSTREAQNAKESHALNADLAWYASHPQTEWDAYVPEIAKVRGHAGGTKVSVNGANGTSNVSGEPDPLLKEVHTMLKSDAEQRASEAAKTSVRELDTHVRTLIKDNPDCKLADLDIVYDKIELYQAKNNGKIPSKDDVKKIVMGVHSALKARGVKEPIGVVPQEGSTRRDVVTSGSTVLPPSNLDKLNMKDVDSVADAYTAYVKSLAER